MANRLYFLTISLNTGEQGGIDLPGMVDKVRNLLCNYSSVTTCVHKFKVTGEAKIVAVFDVSNVIGLERMVAGLARLGNIDVTCKLLKPYEKFAQMLNVDEELTKPSTNCITKEKQLFWLDFTVEYQGKSTEELVSTWTREAKFALEARKSGVNLELFKVVGERKVHVFIAMEPDELDTLTFNLPVMKENGNGVTIVCQAIQCLDDYSSRVSSETL
ncbi:uncharacterized protein LOC123533801 [Mercenaria mercenaria]|uniref:uncharacterized protein LOC123533801 n=1 Tax=Mercenaria mercenaria TaxID=6596 RepID=UPI001E1D331E|nr:uncharacterized protein LOC123533801 [Mercenaria mercenaria]